MIVLSGVLVLVALVLLVVGIIGPLAAVYASIVASLAAAVLLAVAVYARRGPPLRTEGAGQVEPEATGQTWLRDLSGDAQDRDRLQPPATPLAPVQAPAEPAAVPVAAPLPAEPVHEPVHEPADDRIIWVIDERPLYHRQGCFHLSDGEPIPLDVEEAREDGFVPCPVCRPDEVDGAGENDDDDVPFDNDADDEVAPAVSPPAPAAEAHRGTMSAPAEPPRRLGGSVPVGADAAVPVVTAPPVAAPDARPDQVEDPDGTAARESAAAVERERIRVAMPAPVAPAEPPAGLVGRLRRRR